MKDLKKLWQYCSGTVFKPAETFKKISREKRIRYAFLAMLVWSLLYSLFALRLYFSGRIPWTPWVKIPVTTYYLWEALYLTPLNLLLWVLFSALSYLLSGGKRTKGSFESLLSIMGFAWAVPSFLMFWVPDILIDLFFSIKIFNMLLPVYGSLFFIWLMLLASLGLRTVQKLSFKRSLSIALLAFVLHSPLGILLIR